MKIITLNTWGGLAGKEKLLAFFEQYRNTIDVFCLQEIWAAPYPDLKGQKIAQRELDQENIMTQGKQEIASVLSHHYAYFRPHYFDHYGLLVFARKDIKFFDEGEVFVYKHKGYIPTGDVGNHARNIQYLTLGIDGKKITIINFHGLWNGKGKKDCTERIEQSQKIASFLRSLKGEIVFCGDFNLLPDTLSMAILEKCGLRNLIKECAITSTRTSFYEKPDKFADYILVSKGIVVKNFKVLPEEVSDHSPLLIEF